jgi:hypothetical protein
MVERPWAEQAAEILMLVRKYHPILSGVTLIDEYDKPYLFFQARVFSINERLALGASSSAVSTLALDSGWDGLSNAEKRVEISQYAAQLLSGIRAVDCLPAWKDGANALREWLPDAAPTAAEIRIVQEETNAK